jgi:hypothetical protein
MLGRELKWTRCYVVGIVLIIFLSLLFGDNLIEDILVPGLIYSTVTGLIVFFTEKIEY